MKGSLRMRILSPWTHGPCRHRRRAPWPPQRWLSPPQFQTGFIYVKEGFTFRDRRRLRHGADALAIAANELEHCARSRGHRARSPNIFEFVEFGKSVQTKVSGRGEPRRLRGVSFAADYNNDLHAAHRGAMTSEDSPLSAVIKKTLTGTDQETIDLPARQNRRVVHRDSRARPRDDTDDALDGDRIRREARHSLSPRMR